MTNKFRFYYLFIILLIFDASLSYASNSKQIEIEKEMYKVSFIKKYDNAWSFNLQNKKTKEIKKLTYQIDMKEIINMYLYDSKMIILGTNYDSSIIFSVVDLVTTQLIDTVWAYRVVLSSNNRYAIYKEHYPRVVPDGIFVKEVVNIYGFDISPLENTIEENNGLNPRFRGIPVFPEENYYNKDYTFYTKDREKENSILSTFYWFDNDRKILFIEWFNNTNYLITIDITEGIRNSKINRYVINNKLYDNLMDNISEKIVVKSIKEENENIIFTTYQNFSNLNDYKIVVNKKLLY